MVSVTLLFLGADSVFSKFKNLIVNRLLALGLIILCLGLSYIVWNCSYSAFTAISFILTFNSSVILAYKLLGALWVYWFFWKAIGYVLYAVSFIWSYPYISAGLICLLFVFTTLYSIYQWRRGVKRREWNENMIKSISKRLEKMEERQEEIFRQNEEIKQMLLSQSPSQNSK